MCSACQGDKKGEKEKNNENENGSSSHSSSSSDSEDAGNAGGKPVPNRKSDKPKGNDDEREEPDEPICTWKIATVPLVEPQNIWKNVFDLTQEQQVQKLCSKVLKS